MFYIQEIAPKRRYFGLIYLKNMKSFKTNNIKIIS